MRTGSGEVPAPEVNTDVTKSSNESTNTSSADASDGGIERRQRHEPQRAELGGTEIHRGLLDLAIEQREGARAR